VGKIAIFVGSRARPYVLTLSGAGVPPRRVEVERATLE